MRVDNTTLATTIHDDWGIIVNSTGVARLALDLKDAREEIATPKEENEDLESRLRRAGEGHAE